MLPYFRSDYGNPASAWHGVGRRALQATEQARNQVADLLGCEPEAVIFTSGATESNNLALVGLGCSQYGAGRDVVISAQIEHKSVLQPLASLTHEGFTMRHVRVDAEGRIDLEDLSEVVDHNTLLVACQYANQEVGTVQHLREITRIAHARGAFVHCDAAQAAGKLPLDALELGVDSLALCGHKMYGPKGVGALYLSPGLRRTIKPIILGGGQEGGLRSGTLNVPGIVGLGEACRLARDRLDDDIGSISLLRDRFEEMLTARVSGALVNCRGSWRVSGISSITMPDIDADVLLANITGVALSAGSACDSGAWSPSHVLVALGIDREAAGRTFRASLGRSTTMDDVEMAADIIAEAWHTLSVRGM